jgi:hypothetical protein
LIANPLSFSTEVFGAGCPLPPVTVSLAAPPAIEVCVGHGRLINVQIGGFVVGDVDVANEAICRRVIRRANSSTFEIIGLVQGQTTVTVWPEPATSGGVTPPPVQLTLVVGAFSAKYQQLAEFINNRLTNGVPSPDVNVEIVEIPSSGKVLVSGKVKTQIQFQQLKSYVEGAEIPRSNLVYEVGWPCPVCPCHCHRVSCKSRCHKCQR